MSKAGVAITITSFTNILSFALGATSNLPILRSFCVYCCLGIFFDYLWEITFFSSYLAIDIWRESKNCGDCFGACFCKDESWFCFKRALVPGFKSIKEGDTRTDFERTWIGKFFHRWYTPVLLKWWMMIIVGIFFFILTGLGIAGCTQLELEFDISFFVRSDHPLTDVFDIQDVDYSTIGETAYLYLDLEDIETEANQKHLIDLVTELEACTECE